MERQQDIKKETIIDDWPSPHGYIYKAEHVQKATICKCREGVYYGTEQPTMVTTLPSQRP